MSNLSLNQLRPEQVCERIGKSLFYFFHCMRQQNGTGSAKIRFRLPLSGKRVYWILTPFDPNTHSHLDFLMNSPAP